MKPLRLKDEKGASFTYCTPHSMEAMLHQVVKLAGGNVGGSDDSGGSDRLQNRFLVSALIMEEAITSAQLEGASTTREVAKKMLEDDREPVDEDERMILFSFCEFANSDHSGLNGSSFIAPVVKAIILHFMIGYEHPFRDGNGRTARAIFYWYMLKCEYKLFKYVSISKLLKEKPKEYGLSFMYTEKDQNDLTYFIYFQLEIILASFKELENYLDEKAREFQKIAQVLDKTKWGNVLNFVQKDLLKKAVKEPGRLFTAKEVSVSYSISHNTSRTYLNKLVDHKLFLSSKDGKTIVYIAPSDLVSKLEAKN